MQRCFTEVPMAGYHSACLTSATLCWYFWDAHIDSTAFLSDPQLHIMLFVCVYICRNKNPAGELQQLPPVFTVLCRSSFPKGGSKCKVSTTHRATTATFMQNTPDWNRVGLSFKVYSGLGNWTTWRLGKDHSKRLHESDRISAYPPPWPPNLLPQGHTTSWLNEHFNTFTAMMSSHKITRRCAFIFFYFYTAQW